MKKIVLVMALAFCSTTAMADEFFSGTFGGGEFATIELSLSQDLTGPLYFDIDSNGSTDVAGGGAADTELLLFAGLGSTATFIVSDDDDGVGLSSVLTFGAGSGQMLGDSFNLGGDGIADGEDGFLAAGDYTLIVGEFSTADPPGGFGATLQSFIDNGDFGDEAVNYSVTVSHNLSAIPEPSTAALLLGFGAAAFIRRRK